MIDVDLLGVRDEDRELLVRVACWPEFPAWHDLTENALRQIASIKGIDFATALLFDRIVWSPEQEPFLERLQALAEIDTVTSARRLPLVAIVPGAFYLEDRSSGADGRFVREALVGLGCRVEQIPLRSFGSLMENAETICRWLRQRVEDRIVLVSLSKGGAEVKLALTAADAAEIFRNVTAWISLSGLWRGTPLTSWLLAQRWRLPLIRLFFWYRGYHLPALGELERRPGALLDFDVKVPEHLRVIHVVGFPLVRHLSCSLARRGHRRIAPLGPNDGGPILLADLRTLPGWIHPIWGADHYLRPARGLQGMVSRLLRFVNEEEASESLVRQQP